MTDKLEPPKKPSEHSDDEEQAKAPAGDNYHLSGDFRGGVVNIKSSIGGKGNNVRLQNLRDFTVQIRNADDQIVGTGIAVSTDGKIMTCAHVVEKAIGSHPRKANGTEVGVYFPQARGGEEKKYRATVDKCFPHHDDDIVLLQLTGNISPLAPEQIAVLGLADNSEGNPFRTYGYSPLGIYPAKRGEGIIKGSIEPPPNRNLQVDPIQLESSDISEGMSGAAVLDANRNLVVGLVAERYYAEDSDDDDIGFGVDSKVLTFDPFDFEVRGEALGLRPAPEFRLDKDLLEQAIEIGKYILTHRPQAEKYSWNNAPAVLTEWTGREHLLEQIASDWNDPTKHVTGLIGFGGEGKSSLARKWIETLNLRPANLPTGIFWWGFYENRSVDEFLEAALNYMSGGRIDSRQIQSSNLRAQIIGAMLGTGRYLFVLDGLEVIQHQEGDQYGLLQNNDLRDLLTFFARPDNQSFCLITSRAPLLDLMDYTTYTHCDVDRFSEEDGRALLRRLGVKASDVELDKVISDWDGHALTLSILAAYLAERYEGDIHHLADIPVPTADEPRYERVHRVLRRYDEHLTDDEREFLKLFSVFRLPVQESAFDKVFEPLLVKNVGAMHASPLRETVTRLANYRLIRHDEHEQAYTTHPLIRNHYFALFTKDDPAQEKATHSQIKDYYLSIAGNTPQYPTLDDLKPLIEVVHHACEAGVYDDAWNILWERIYQKEKFFIAHRLGAYDTAIYVLFEFFEHGIATGEPKVSNLSKQAWILNSTGHHLMNLGRLREAVQYFERAAKRRIEAQSWGNASQTQINLSDVYFFLGALDASAASAHQALEFAQRVEDKFRESQSLSHLAWAKHTLGELQNAQNFFGEAEAVEIQRDNKQVRYLYSNRGIFHAEYLRRTKQSEYARRITQANLKICEENHVVQQISQCHRILGDFDSDSGNHESARGHYEAALKIVRGISVRDVLIESLLARGRWQAKYAETLVKALNLRKDDLVTQAFNDLNEALGYCVVSGYRIYEADVRVALGWAYLANGEKEKAKQSAERALQMSNEMGYHWGKVDAEEVLERIESSEQKVGKEKRTTKAAKQTKKKSPRS